MTDIARMRKPTYLCEPIPSPALISITQQEKNLFARLSCYTMAGAWSTSRVTRDYIEQATTVRLAFWTDNCFVCDGGIDSLSVCCWFVCEEILELNDGLGLIRRWEKSEVFESANQVILKTFVWFWLSFQRRAVLARAQFSLFSISPLHLHDFITTPSSPARFIETGSDTFNFSLLFYCSGAWRADLQSSCLLIKVLRHLFDKGESWLELYRTRESNFKTLVAPSFWLRQKVVRRHTNECRCMSAVLCINCLIHVQALTTAITRTMECVETHQAEENCFSILALLVVFHPESSSNLSRSRLFFFRNVSSHTVRLISSSPQYPPWCLMGNRHNQCVLRLPPKKRAPESRA